VLNLSRASWFMRSMCSLSCWILPLTIAAHPWCNAMMSVSGKLSYPSRSPLPPFDLPISSRLMISWWKIDKKNQRSIHTWTVCPCGTHERLLLVATWLVALLSPFPFCLC
jgi:hypothetical protein